MTVNRRAALCLHVLIAGVLAVGMLTGCAGSASEKARTNKNGESVPETQAPEVGEAADSADSAESPDLVRAKTAGASLTLNAEELRLMNIFMSNFSEAHVAPFRAGAIPDETLVRFAIKHNYINDRGAITVLPDGRTASLVTSEVDDATKKYFGETPEALTSYRGLQGTPDIQYVSGAYQFPVPYGEPLPFTHIARVDELPDGTLEVTGTIYQPNETYSPDVIDVYGSTIEQLDSLFAYDIGVVGEVRATLKRKVWNGNDTYELVAYKTN